MSDATSRTSMKRATPSQDDARFSVPPASIHRVEVDGVQVFYRVIAPDLPGFGFTEVPPEQNYSYSFDRLALTIDAFTQALKLDRYAIYVFDYGAPIGFRLAMAHPDRIRAIVSQNGNAYEEGLGDA